jgi:hypothetical protein
MAKKISDQNEIARQLWADAFEGRIITPSTEQQFERWTKERRDKLARQAEELFKTISKASFLGPEVATEIFRATAAKRRRGSQYCSKLNRALMLHAAVNRSPTKTARRAIELGLERKQDEEALIKIIGRLLRKGKSGSK